MERQSPVQEVPATQEEVIETFRSGNRQEGMKLFDEWYQRRIRESDGTPTSAERLVIAVETFEIYAVSEDLDTLRFEFSVLQENIGSDTSLNDAQRTELAQRLAKAWTDASGTS